MTELHTVTWTKIPIVGLPDFACQIDVTEDGRTLDAEGEPLPKDLRPFKCSEDGHWFVGQVPLCAEHAREVAELMGDDIEDIFQAWKARL